MTAEGFPRRPRGVVTAKESGGKGSDIPAEVSELLVNSLKSHFGCVGVCGVVLTEESRRGGGGSWISRRAGVSDRCATRQKAAERAAEGGKRGASVQEGDEALATG